MTQAALFVLGYFAVGFLLVVVMADDRTDFHFEETAKPFQKFLVALLWPIIVALLLLTP
jgi:hypothetical protein